MSFGKTKRRLQALINRKDLTDALAGDFVTEAIADLERSLRIGPMEALLTVTAWDGTANTLNIPYGHLELINLFTSRGEMTQVDLAEFIRLDGTGGIPTHFCRVGPAWLLKPTPAIGTPVHLHYYAQGLPLVVDADENVWIISAFNAVVYQAAALAADFFQMEDTYAQRFQARAADYMAAIADQDLNEKWSGRIAIPLPSDLGPY